MFESERDTEDRISFPKLKIESAFLNATSFDMQIVCVY